MKFETVQINFLSDVFSLSSFRNFATMATLGNNFSSLLAGDNLNLPVAITDTQHISTYVATFVWTSTKNEWNAQNEI